MPTDVFISYSSKDKVIADAACATLESAGIRCWIAPRDAMPGKPYAECIVDGIASSRLFVLIFSGNSNSSQQVLREVELAVGQGMNILMFRIEDLKPTKAMKYYVSAPHWLDALTRPLEKHLLKLAEDVGRHLEIDSKVPRTPTSEPRTTSSGAPSNWPQSRLTLKLLGLVAMLAMIGGAAALFRPSSRNSSEPSPSVDPSAPFATLLQELRGKLPAEITKAELEQLDGFANTSDKKEQQKQFLEEYEAAIAAQIDRQLSSITSDFESLQSGSQRDVSKLNELSTQLNKLCEQEFPELKGPQLDAAEKLLGRVDAEISALEFDKGLAGVKFSADDLPGFYAALDTLVSAHPEAAEERGYSRSLKEQGYAEGVLAWSGFLRALEAQDPQELDPAQAGKLRARGMELTEKYPIGFFSEPFRQKQEYLRRIAARTDFAGKDVHSALRNDLTEVLYSDVYEARLRGAPPKRYYLRQDPATIETANGKKVLPYIEGFNLEIRRERVTASDIEFEGIAPHCTLASEVLQRIETAADMTTTGWEPAFVAALERIQQEKAADPLVTVAIFEKTLGKASEGSLPLKQAFEEHQRQLNATAIDPITEWFDPQDEKANSARQTAANLLQRFPSCKMAGQDAKRRLAEFQQPIGIRCRAVAWAKLPRNGSTWEAVDLLPNCPEGPLYIVAETSPGVGTFEEVGSVARQAVRWNTLAKDTLQEGRVLFLRTCFEIQVYSFASRFDIKLIMAM